MKKQLKNIAIGIGAAVVLGIVPAFAQEAPGQKAEPVIKYGFVDVNKVVAASKAVEKANKERAAEKKKIIKFIEESANKMNKEEDEKKREEMKNQFDLDLTAKKSEMNKSYGEKLMKINNDINAELIKIAKDKDYQLILTKEAVLYGGDDLTQDLIKVVK